MIHICGIGSQCPMYEPPAPVPVKTYWGRCPVCGHHANMVEGIDVCPTCDGE